MTTTLDDLPPALAALRDEGLISLQREQAEQLDAASKAAEQKQQAGRRHWQDLVNVASLDLGEDLARLIDWDYPPPGSGAWDGSWDERRAWWDVIIRLPGCTEIRAHYQLGQAGRWDRRSFDVRDPFTLWRVTRWWLIDPAQHEDVDEPTLVEHPYPLFAADLPRALALATQEERVRRDLLQQIELAAFVPPAATGGPWHAVESADDPAQL